MSSDGIDVLLLSHRYNITSGGEKALLEMITYLNSIGLKLHVIVGGQGDIEGRLNSIGVPYTIIHLPFWAHGGEDNSSFVFNQPLNPSNNTTLAISNLIKELRPRLCATNTIVVPWLAYAAATTNTPHAWMIHELDTGGLNLQFAIDNTQILRTIDALSDKIFYNSKYTAQHYTPRLIFNKDTSVIYPSGGVSLTSRSKNPFKSTGLKIICVSQIKQQKGQLDAVNAAVILDKKGLDFELLFVGDFNEDDKKYNDALHKIVKDNSIGDKVRFLGYSSDPSSLTRHSDIALSCATGETFGRIVVEAMLCGVPVIGAESAGTTEIIKPGYTGLLYEPGNHNELVEKILQLHYNPELLKMMSKNAIRDSERRYSDKERFRVFVEYLRSNPRRTALNLEPLDSVLLDFQSSVLLVSKNGLSIKRMLSKTKKIFRQIMGRGFTS